MNAWDWDMIDNTESLDSLYCVINDVAATASKNKKIEILDEEYQNSLLKVYLNFVYNPKYVYYVSDVEVPPTAGNFKLTEALLHQISNNIAGRSVTGHAARDYINSLMVNLNLEGQQLVKWMLEKDLKAGIDISTINKVWDSLIPKQPYMRCSLPKHVKQGKFEWEKGAYVQLKCDGMFAYLKVKNNGSTRSIESRSGSVFPIDQFQNIIDSITEDMSGMVLHGEMLVEQDGVVLPRHTGNGILNSILKGGAFEANQKAVYVVWDITTDKQTVPKGKSSTPYSTRFDELLHAVGCGDISVVENTIVYSYEAAIEIAMQYIKDGFEGAIVKKHSSIWKDGTSTEVFKIKVECDVDLLIVGFNIGKDALSNTLGTISCCTSDELLHVNVSGYTLPQRDYVWAHQSEFMHKIMVVTFNDIMLPSESNEFHSLFLPRSSLEIRMDKLTADTLPEVFAQLEAAKGLK